MRIVDLCPACSGPCPEMVASLDEKSAIRFSQFDNLKYGGTLSGWIDSIPPIVLRCGRCGHSWYQNQPEQHQLSTMYSMGRSLKLGIIASREPTPHMRKEMRLLRGMVDGGKGPTSMLDFGSGSGRWSRAAVLEGFLVTAYEPSVERGSESHAPFELVHSMEELKDRKFDVIQLEQVLEHVPDVLETLWQLQQFCKPHTVLRITVPNLLRDSDGRNIWSTWPFDGEKPHFLAPYEHLHGFTPKSLDCLLWRAGFKNIEFAKEGRLVASNLIRRKLGIFFPHLNSTLRYVKKIER